MSQPTTGQSSLCVISHGVDKQGVARTAEAKHGRLCLGHSKRLAEWLREIAVDYVLLDTVAAPASHWGEPASGHSTESQPPMNLTVAALRDTERGGAPRERGDELWYELPDIPSIVSTLHARAEALRCMLDPTREAEDDVKDWTVIGETNYLLGAFNTLVCVDWVDEAFDDFKRLWVALQSAHGRPRPRALGKCLSLSCDGTVWERPHGFPWCSKCKRLYETAADLARLSVQEEKRKKVSA